MHFVMTQHLPTTPDTDSRSQLRATINLSGSIVSLDGAWHQQLGWPAEGLLDTIFVTHVYPDDLEHVISAIHLAVSNEQPVRFRCRYSHYNNSYLPINWQAHFKLDTLYIELIGLLAR
ncbi:hypothetical protein A9Q02_16300 [Candidatus Chloroploca asiatica]|uniref:PAS fold-3 domain-containing protein n=2 Tax=Candidatus Chloroploca asiatica TaxID=1506545 RepID=A0A2H3KSP0_9CHLR|nr:hypothetical protein A9Q02_16300 [Candidatus Chloroploca asiatica]